MSVSFSRIRAPGGVDYSTNATLRGSVYSFLVTFMTVPPGVTVTDSLTIWYPCFEITISWTPGAIWLSFSVTGERSARLPLSTITIASAGSVTISSITVAGGGGGAGSDCPGFAGTWAAGREGS